MHGFHHVPLVRALDLVDVLAVSAGLDRGSLDALASAWGVRRLWRATLAAADAVLLGSRRRPWTVWTWARGLSDAR